METLLDWSKGFLVLGLGVLIVVFVAYALHAYRRTPHGLLFLLRHRQNKLVIGPFIAATLVVGLLTRAGRLFLRS